MTRGKNQFLNKKWSLIASGTLEKNKLGTIVPPPLNYNSDRDMLDQTSASLVNNHFSHSLGDNHELVNSKPNHKLHIT